MSIYGNHSVEDGVLIWYDRAVTTKEIALKTIEQLPENASWEDIQVL